MPLNIVFLRPQTWSWLKPYYWSTITAVKANQRKGENEKLIWISSIFVWILVFFPWENKRDSHRTLVPESFREEFTNWPFFGLVCRGDSWKNFVQNLRSGRWGESFCWEESKGCLNSTELPRVGIPKPGIPKSGIPQPSIPKPVIAKEGKTHTGTLPETEGFRSQGFRSQGFRRQGFRKLGFRKLGIPKMDRFRAPFTQTPLRLPLTLGRRVRPGVRPDFGRISCPKLSLWAAFPFLNSMDLF